MQDRDLDALPESERRAVRRLQRRYIELWMECSASCTRPVPAGELRVRVQATFGLINSTPHSVRAAGPSIDAEPHDPCSNGWPGPA